MRSAFRELPANIEGEDLASVAADLEHNRAERHRLDQQLREIEAESRRLAQRWAEIEQRNVVLSNLYIAVRQLHGTLVRAEVLEALVEIVIGLIGSEEFAIFDRSDDGTTFRVVASTGIDENAYRQISATTHPLGRMFASGKTETALVAVVPLLLNGRVTGGIAVFSLLAQKPALLDSDRELLDLLSTHAAIALHCTTLIESHARSGA